METVAGHLIVSRTRSSRCVVQVFVWLRLLRLLYQ